MNELITKLKNIGLPKLSLLLLAGILLLCSDRLSKTTKINNEINVDTNIDDNYVSDNKESRELENILKKIKGIEDINVLITYDSNNDGYNLYGQNTSQVLGVIVVYKGEYVKREEIAKAIKVATGAEYNKIEIFSME